MLSKKVSTTSPYLRDFLMDRDVLADVSGMSRCGAICYLSMKGHDAPYKPRLMPKVHRGWSVATSAISYHAGASLYFTFGFVAKAGDEMGQYLRIKKAAEDTFLENGATLSTTTPSAMNIFPGWKGTFRRRD